MRPSFVLVIVSTRRDYEQLFVHLNALEPPGGLFEKIMNRIRKECRLRTLRCRIALFSFGLAISGAALVPAYQMMRTAIAESGFMQFLSLLFSDFSVVAAYWRSFALALLETLPIVSIAALLAVVLIFLGSLRYLFRDIRAVSLSLRLRRPRSGLYVAS